jgi:glycine C-acetyltransferase
MRKRDQLLDPMHLSILNFIRQKGTTLRERNAPFSAWIEASRQLGVMTLLRCTAEPVGPVTRYCDDHGAELGRCLNFGSQDYLGLASHGRVIEAAHRAILEHGVHSAGSSVLGGRTVSSLRLEAGIASFLGYEDAVLYPTGWAAGFGLLAGLVRSPDYVVMDALSHNCIQEGARHNTQNVALFQHNHLDDLKKILLRIRAADSDCGIFVISESLFSMDSDSPDLKELVSLCRDFEAISVVDIAHDLGCMGENGRGILDGLSPVDYPDIVLGSFSKVFAANGGFVACSSATKDYLQFNSPPLTFSNALCPVSTGVIQQCLEIVLSQEGKDLRDQLRTRIVTMRNQLNAAHFGVVGTPSPIIPVIIGSERQGRLMARGLQSRTVIANFVEFPAVPKNKSRFRLQMMASHDDLTIHRCVEALVASRDAAKFETRLTL